MTRTRLNYPNELLPLFQFLVRHVATSESVEGGKLKSLSDWRRSHSSSYNRARTAGLHLAVCDLLRLPYIDQDHVHGAYSLEELRAAEQEAIRTAPVGGSSLRPVTLNHDDTEEHDEFVPLLNSVTLVKEQADLDNELADLMNNARVQHMLEFAYRTGHAAGRSAARPNEDKAWAASPVRAAIEMALERKASREG